VIKVKLLLWVPGASDGELQRGLQSAQAVLEAGGVTVGDYAEADLKSSSECSEEQFTARERRSLSLWPQAHQAAIAACCQGWQQVPRDARLSYDWLPTEWDQAVMPAAQPARSLRYGPSGPQRRHHDPRQFFAWWLLALSVAYGVYALQAMSLLAAHHPR
jgi:hypothetical protein